MRQFDKFNISTEFENVSLADMQGNLKPTERTAKHKRTAIIREAYMQRILSRATIYFYIDLLQIYILYRLTILLDQKPP